MRAYITAIFRKISDWINPKQPELELYPIKDSSGRVVQLVDRHYKEHLESTAPNPSQAELDEMLGKADRVRILEGGVVDANPVGKEVLLDVSGQLELEALRDAMEIKEDKRSFSHCMCHGDYAMEFYSGTSRIAVIGLHHGVSIRWDAWKYDAALKKNLDLLNWLEKNGMPQPMAEYRKDREAEEARVRRYREWAAQMHPCLAPYLQDMLSEGGGIYFFPASLPENQAPGAIHVRAKPWMEALEEAVPVPEERALLLLRWFGSGMGPWSGVPTYEVATEELLLLMPTETIVQALTSYERVPEPQVLEGAARYFAGWHFNSAKPGERTLIPPALKTQLLEHTLLSDDEDKRERAERFFL